MKFEVDVRELVSLQQKLGALPARLAEDALAMGLNRTAEKGKTEIDRAVRDEYVLSAAHVRNSLNIRKASRLQSRFEATIQIFGSPSKKGRSMNVIAFMLKRPGPGAKIGTKRRKQLFVQGRGGRLYPVLKFVFKRGSGPKEIAGAFVGNKGRTVFRRVGKGRLPIEPVRVIDVGQMFSSRKISRRVLERIERDLPVEIDRAVKGVMARFAR